MPDLKIEAQADNSINKVLFIQAIPDIRTIKIANVLHKEGIQVDLVYKTHPSMVYKDLEFPFTNTYELSDFKMISFVRESDYDILYSSNEPDSLTVLFLAAGKPIIHDTHDMMSLRTNITSDQIIMEYLANVQSTGNIYVTNLVKDIAFNGFNIKGKPFLTLNNFIDREHLPEKYYEKLSKSDKEIHCVYEGGLTNIQNHHRYLEPFLLKLVQNRIHIHLHCPADPEYMKHLTEMSEYIHHEKLLSPKDLITEMTKYDIGLAIVNVTERNRLFLDTTFPNKIWDYLASGLPVLLSNCLPYRLFAEESGTGKVFVPDEDIIKQAEDTLKIQIDRDILIKNNWLMDNAAPDIIKFMGIVKASFYSKQQGSINRSK